MVGFAAVRFRAAGGDLSIRYFDSPHNLQQNEGVENESIITRSPPRITQSNSCEL